MQVDKVNVVFLSILSRYELIFSRNNSTVRIFVPNTKIKRKKGRNVRF